MEGKGKTQHQQVIDVMLENGGFATLGYLYQFVNVSEWKTKTPFKTINRIVQDHRFFFRIRPGLWGLNARKRDVLEKFRIDNLNEETQEVFDHSYFQGLLVEIGNLRGLNTFVPNQDKNRQFLSRKLGDLASMQSIFDFAYPNLVRRAQTVDVIWFNQRKMPAAFFEVEHSTDIYNSLIKFSDLTDFNASFCIVANQVRKREYEQKLSSSIFDRVRGRINFLSYEHLSEMHSNASKINKLEEVVNFLRN